MTANSSDSHPAPRSGFRTVLRTAWRSLLIGCAAVLVLFAMQRGNGALLLLVVPVFLLALSVQLLQYFRQAATRQRRRRGIAGLLSGLVLAVLAQSYWHWQQMQTAEQAVAALVVYRQQHGAYPDTLAATGMPADADHGLRYQLRPAGPDLRYSATVSPLTEYVYDFATQRWQRNPD